MFLWSQLYLKMQMQAIDVDYTIDESEKTRRKQVVHHYIITIIVLVFSPGFLIMSLP